MQALELNKINELKERIHQEILSHPIIHHNEFTQWFERGEMNLEQLKAFTVQFSVFSNLFLVAQLKKMINAPSLEAMRSSKEILANEIGVSFNAQSKADIDEDGIPIRGSIDGGRFRFKAGHFEWLLNFARPLGLEFPDLGKRIHGTEATLHFTDALERIYGSSDLSISAGASFAIENWAAAGFWKELIKGLKTWKEDNIENLNIGFFVWHDRVEDQHAEHTQEELEELLHDPNMILDPQKFIQGGIEILDAIAIFWNGLNRDRLNIRE